MHPKGLSGGRYELAQGLARARQEGVPGLRGGGTWQPPVTGFRELEVRPQSWEPDEQASQERG